MDLQTRKLNTIRYLINLQAEKVFNEIEASIDAIKSHKKPSPLTRKQLVDRAKRSNEDYLAGSFKSQEELELESENW